MLKIEKDVPLKDTIHNLSKFPQFSLLEKIPPKFYTTPAEASKQVARQIRELIESRNKQGKTCVLGLATGNTPIGVYKQLIKMHKEHGLSFKNVVTFNLDEYYPLSHKDPQSYHYFMDHHLFNHIDIPRQNINVPSGETDKENVTKFCEEYEKKILECGGIDLQILGIGRTGHIGFNEPPSPSKSITRLVYLHRLTRKDAAPSFGGIENVPKCAITMGIDTINKAKKIVIMAWSESKSPIVKESIEGEKTSENPSTFLHDHSDATFYLDLAAGEKLSRFIVPWTIKGDYQDPTVPRTKYWILRSVIWLSEITKKPLLRLTNDDYEDNGLSPLVIECARGKVEDLNLYVFECIVEKITAWPLNDKPVLSENFIHRKSVQTRKILIFSPHPGNDVISMGSTMEKLVTQGHHVSVAYMTAGTNGVHDHQAQKYLYFLRDFNNTEFWKGEKEEEELNTETFDSFNHQIKGAFQHIKKKTENDRRDSELLVKIKEFIRHSESKISVEYLGINPANVYSLNLPFYGYNNTKKKISEKDYEIVRELLKKIQPEYIYAAGDLTDPHGTHRKCLDIILKVVAEEHQKVVEDPNYKPIVPPSNRIFLYRGAWEEWDITIARSIVLMSPQQVQEKNAAIMKHQSQKDNPLFPGDDHREFWLRTQERNRNTAERLNSLGFSDYEAVECFVDLNDIREFGEL